MRLGHHPQLDVRGAGRAQGQCSCSGSAAGGDDIIDECHAQVFQ